jgi:hypothetical protein
MALTKLEARELIREQMDDASSKLWSDSLLDRLTTTTLDTLWGELLEHAPRLTSQLDTIATLQTPGYIRTQLTTDTPAGDLTQRFRRVQSVMRGEQMYTEVDPRRVAVQGNVLVANDGRDFVYFLQGKQIWLLPLDTAEDVELRYSYLPAKYSGLANGDNVEWPEGFEDAYTWEVAGRAMLKGGRENADSLLGVAARSMAQLRSLIKTGGVIMPYHNMPAQAWGGE